MFINRRLHVWRASKVARHYLTVYVIYLLSVALFAAISVSLSYEMGLVNFGISISWLLFLVCGSLIFSTINHTVIPSLNFLGYSWEFVLLSVATIAASLTCATLLVQMVDPSTEYWLLGQLLGQIFIGAIGVKVLFMRLQPTRIVDTLPSIHRRHLHTLFSFAWPIAIAAGLGWVQGQGYRYLMEEQLGLAQLGLFVAGYGISAGMIAGFESVLTTYFQPRLYRDASMEYPVRQAQAWQRYAAAVIPSLILTVALVAMLAPELTHIFLGEDFQSARDYVVWGAVAEAARVLAGVYSLIAHIYMRTKWLILPSFIGAALSITLCSLLIPIYGAAGVGAGLIVSGYSMVVTMHVLLARHVGGGAPTRLMLMAGVFAAVLWVLLITIRHLLDVTGMWLMVGTLVPIGTTYLGMQYFSLRQHLTDKGEA
jgi:O-antigen/teichoic acid export membrane protein